MKSFFLTLILVFSIIIPTQIYGQSVADENPYQVYKMDLLKFSNHQYWEDVDYTYIFNEGAKSSTSTHGHITFATSNTNRLRIKNNGNIQMMGGELSNWSNLILNANDDALGTEHMIFKIKGSEYMRLADGGKFGIGTDNPTEKLQVKGNLRLTGDGSGTISSWSNLILNANDDALGTEHMIFKIKGSEYMRLADRGKFGIGTDNPFATLDVNGDIFTSIHGSTNIHDITEQGSRFIGHKSGNTTDGFTGMKINIGAYGKNGYNNGSKISFQTWGNSIAQSRDVMTIDAFGKIGIGTTNPSNNLQVIGTTKTDSLVINASSGAQLLLGSVIDPTENTNSVGITSGSIGHQLLCLGSTNYPTTVQIDTSGDMFVGFDKSISLPKLIQAAKSNYSLFVKYGVLSEDFTIRPIAGWSDYVFHKDYALMPLHEVENYISANKHLPNIPSQAEVSQEGYSMHDMNKKLLEKIEELTLYVIEQQKQMNEIKSKIEKIENQ